jgi:hypothetical protein
MIVRINQIDAETAERAGGWDAQGPRAEVKYVWPASAFVYQILVMEQDEHGQQLESGFVQTQLRRLIPHVMASLSSAEDQVVLRLDGAIADAELLGAMAYVVDPIECRKFAMSAVQRLWANGRPAIGSVRLAPTYQHLSTLCSDLRVGLEHTVRLRALALPEQLVDPMLDTSDVDDERWRDILPRGTFMLSTSRGLTSLLIWTERFDPGTAKNRIVRRLSGI